MESIHHKDKFSNALKAETDEDALEEFHRTKSLSLKPPETGTIAVKVINQYGDKVLRVYVV